MYESNLQIADQQARTLNTILREDHGWKNEDFVDGMAPLTLRSGVQVWRPRRKLRRKIFGRKVGKTIDVIDIVKTGKVLKFLFPNEKTIASMGDVELKDFQNWKGFFDREATYLWTDIDAHMEADRLGKSLRNVLQQMAKGKTNLPDPVDVIFNTWLEFCGFKDSISHLKSTKNFELAVKFPDAPIEARIPTIVLFGAKWIKIANSN